MRYVENTRPANPRQEKARSKLGYKFDPMPDFLPSLYQSRAIIAFDERVLRALLRFRRQDHPSCWTTKEIVARQLGVCCRTVQSSLARLKAAGVIDHRRIGRDSTDVANRTGWRFYFLWIDQSGEQVPASRGEQPPAPRGEQFAAPKKTLDRTIPDRTKSSSSTPQESDDDDSAPQGSQAEEFQTVIESAKRDFPTTNLAATIEADASRIGRKLGNNWNALAAAIAMAAVRREKPRSLFGWILATACDYATNGISAEAVEAVRRRKASEVARVTLAVRTESAPPPDDMNWLRQTAANPRHRSYCVAVARLAELSEVAPAIAN